MTVDRASHVMLPIPNDWADNCNDIGITNDKKTHEIDQGSGSYFFWSGYSVYSG